MDQRRAPQPGDNLHRSIALDHRAAEGDQPEMFSASFTSEEPYLRWFGYEILDHSKGAVNLERATDGLPFLFAHDFTSAKTLIGRIFNLRVENGRVRGDLRFFSDEESQCVAQKVREGHREMSARYSVDEMVLEKANANGEDVYRVTKWTLLEGSVVSVPADATVGVGRQYFQPAASPAATAKGVQSMDQHQTAPAGAAAETRAADQQNVVTLERERSRQIRELGRMHNQTALADAAVDDGTSLDAFRAKLLEAVRANPTKPVATTQAEGRVAYGEGARARFRYQKLNPVWGTGPEGEERAYRAGMWARAAVFGDHEAMQWCRGQGMDMQIRAMGENTGTGGGFLVPIEMEQAVIDLRDEYGVAGRLARQRPMGSDQRSIPKKTGRPQAYFTEFDTAWTESDQSWSNVILSAKRLACATRIDTDLVEDAVIDIATDVASDFAWAFAKKGDECLLIGDGTSTYAGIRGFNPLFEATAYASRATTQSGHDTFAEIDAVDLAQVLAAVAAFGKRGAVWVCSQEFKAMVFDRLSAAAGGNTMAMLGGMPAESYLGYPIVTSQAMPAGVSTDYTSKSMALFGNFQMASSMGRRRGITVQVLREKYATQGQIGIIASERMDVVVHDIGDTTNKGAVASLYGNS